MRLNLGVKFKNIFGVNLLTTLFCKLDNCITVTIIFLCCEMIQLSKKSDLIFAKKFYDIDSRGLYSKTFYGRNLRIFLISKGVCPGKPFQPCLMFVGEARSLPQSGSPETCFQVIKDKHSCLLWKSVNYGRKNFNSTGHWLFHKHYNNTVCRVIGASLFII